MQHRTSNSTKTSINGKPTQQRGKPTKVPPIRAKQFNNASLRLGHQDRHQTILKLSHSTTNMNQVRKTNSKTTKDDHIKPNRTQPLASLTFQTLYLLIEKSVVKDHHQNFISLFNTNIS